MRKLSFVILGWVCVVTGIIGVFLPILPTTPFLLVAAWAFAKSSPKFESWLVNHETLGPYIYDWRHYGTVPLKAKILAITMMSASFMWLSIWSGAPTIVIIMVGITLACVAAFLLSRPSTNTESAD